MIIATVSFGIAVASAAIANRLVFVMIAEVNRVIPVDKHISNLGFTFAKVVTTFREYRAHYPYGRLGVYALIAYLGLFAGIVVAAMALSGDW